MIDRLQEQAVFVREDRGYNVDHLGEVGDLDGLAVAGEHVEVGGDGQCIGEVVAFFEACGLLPLAEPDVPLVVGNVDGVFHAPFVAGSFDHGPRGAQGAVSLVGGEDVRPVVVASRVDVYAVVVDERREAFDHHPVPIRQAAEAAADELYVLIRQSHHLGELTGFTHVVFGGERPDLPLTIHLVAQSPVLDVVRILVAVLAPEVRPVGIACTVAVLYPGLGFVHRARAYVDADVWFCPHQAAVLDKLVRAEAVGLLGGPCKIHLPRTLLPRAYPVRPVVTANEVSAGPTQDRYPQAPRGLEHIPAVAPVVAKGRALVEDASIDAAAEVLDKAPEYPSVQLADPSVRVDLDPGQPLLLSRVCKEVYGPLCKLVGTLPAAACQHFSISASWFRSKPNARSSVGQFLCKSLLKWHK